MREIFGGELSIGLRTTPKLDSKALKSSRVRLHPFDSPLQVALILNSHEIEKGIIKKAETRELLAPWTKNRKAR